MWLHAASRDIATIGIGPGHFSALLREATGEFPKIEDPNIVP